MEDNATVKDITELQILLRQNQEDMKELKTDMKDLKKCLPSLEKYDNLNGRVVKIENIINKVAWVVIIAVITSVLSLVLIR
jgi:hypothetical protein